MLLKRLKKRVFSTKKQHSRLEKIYCRKAALKNQWCFTNGNAAAAITKFFNALTDLEQLDWHSIRTPDFRDQNADGDEDRVRKKHSEFLVKYHVPVEKLATIIVKNQRMEERVAAIIADCNLEIPVHINPKSNYYF